MEFLKIFLPVLCALQINGWMSMAILVTRARRKQKSEADALAKLFGEANDRSWHDSEGMPFCPCPACVSRRELRVN